MLASGFSCFQRHPLHYSCQCSAPSVSAAIGYRGPQLRWRLSPQTRLYRLPSAAFLHLQEVECQQSPTVSSEQRSLYAQAKIESETNISDGIQAQISGISQLSPDLTIFQNWVEAFVVGRCCCGFEMLNVFTQSQGLSRQSELLLDCFEGSNVSSGIVRTKEIPGVKPRKVLEGSQKLVATN